VLWRAISATICAAEGEEGGTESPDSARAVDVTVRGRTRRLKAPVTKSRMIHDNEPGRIHPTRELLDGHAAPHAGYEGGRSQKRKYAPIIGSAVWRKLSDVP